jgi:hypothetical protein
LERDLRKIKKAMPVSQQSLQGKFITNYLDHQKTEPAVSVCKMAGVCFFGEFLPGGPVIGGLQQLAAQAPGQRRSKCMGCIY